MSHFDWFYCGGVGRSRRTTSTSSNGHHGNGGKKGTLPLPQSLSPSLDNLVTLYWHDHDDKEVVNESFQRPFGLA